MMKSEFLDRLHSIPGHEQDDVTQDNYARIEYVYMFHPSIHEVGGKDAIAHIYAYGGMLVINDMYPRSQKADEVERRISALRKDIQGMERQIDDLKKEVLS